MSGSTPSDLAVTFRSIGRRHREAIGDSAPGAVAGLSGELNAHIGAAAAVLGVAADPTSIAAAIDARQPDDWDDATLDALRQHALDAGAVLRRISEQVAAQRGDDD